MVLWALPPNFKSRCPCEHLWCLSPVFFVVPLGSYLRHKCCQICFAGYWPLSRAERAPFTVRAIRYCSLPFMPFLTEPPNFSVGIRHYLSRLQAIVFISVPFSCQHRIDCFQVVYAWNGISAVTIRTSAVIFPCSGTHNRLPFMAFLAAPPDPSPR